MTKPKKYDPHTELLIESYKTLYSSKPHYQIRHAITKILIADGYRYKSTAVKIAREIALEIGGALVVDTYDRLKNIYNGNLKQYLLSYRYVDDKSPLSFGEWLNGDNTSNLYSDSRNSSDNVRSEAEHTNGISTLTETVGWIPDPIDGQVLERRSLETCAKGRPTYGAHVLDEDEA